jgi:hypothetical protein
MIDPLIPAMRTLGLIADHAGLGAVFAVPAAAYFTLEGFAFLAWRTPPLSTNVV